MDQATAVNHTCSFTDACVGGSESKTTERLCLSVYVARGFLYFVAGEVTRDKKKMDGNDCVREGEPDIYAHICDRGLR